MYLSRVELNTSRKSTLTTLASPQKMHATVENSFPTSLGDKKRNLWRIDKLGNALYLLVLSDGKPDFTHIVEQCGWSHSEQNWETKDYTPFLESIKTGQRWQFRLRANPVRSVRQTDTSQKQEFANRGKVYAHVTVQQQEHWLLERAVNYGFSLQEGSFHVVQHEVRQFMRQGNRVTLGTATFEGILEVESVELFSHALTQGIGRAKAYGCGLLTIVGVLS